MDACRSSARRRAACALTALAWLAPGCAPASSEAAPAAPAMRIERRGSMVFLANPRVRIGVDLAKGGSITFLAAGGSAENLVNDHDLGRQVQMSFYSGPKPYGRPSPHWQGWGWNPIGSGDVHGNGPRATAAMDEGELHVRTVPLQWALDGVRSECTFETWIGLDGPQVRVRSRLVNARADHTQYPAVEQELPAVYTIGRLRRLLSYTGDRPFTGGAPTQRPSRFPWSTWMATEGWSAFVDENGAGVGIVNGEAQSFGGGFYGPLKDGGARDPQTGFMRPGLDEIIDHDIVYDYRYRLVVGTVAEIRAAAAAARPADPLPDYRFLRDRQHWTYADATDTGWPIRGRLDVGTASPDPQLIGPLRLFRADAVPALHLRAAFAGRGGMAQLFWSTHAAPGFAQERSRLFPVVFDGRMRTYRIDLAGHSAWRGAITRLRLDPPPGGKGARMQICALSHVEVRC